MSRLHVRFLIGLALFASIGGASAVRAGVIVGYDTSQPPSHNIYDRFLSPFPTAPVQNTNSQFILNPFAAGTGPGHNLTSLGWSAQNSTFGVTLVSPQHIIGNFHVFQSGLFQPGTSVNFVNRNGELKTYTLSSAQPFRPTTTFNIGQGNQTLPSDVYLGTLSAPIPASDLVDFMPVLTGPQSSFTNVPFFAYGQNPAYVNPSTGTASPHFGRNNVDSLELLSFDGAVPINEATQATVYDFNSALTGEMHLIGGDSGSPSLVNVGGQLGLLGTHYGLDPATNTSADAFVPFYISQLNAAMAPTGFQLTLIGVPEPSSFMLVGGLAAAWLARRRRKSA